MISPCSESTTIFFRRESRDKMLRRVRPLLGI
jgi:hypothetical protein